MPMHYDHDFLTAGDLPRARLPLLQHLVETYASETNKTAAVWSELTDAQLDFRPHRRSSSVRQILVHQMLSERRFFAEFIGLRGAAGGDAAAAGRCARRVRRTSTGWSRWPGPGSHRPGRRGRSVLAGGGAVLRRAARADLGILAAGASHGPPPGPGRRSALRLLEDRVPPTYGPTADVTWSGADPPQTLDAVHRAQR